MTDRRDANQFPPLTDLIDDPVGANSQRQQAFETTAQSMTGVRIGFEDRKGIDDCVGEPRT
jgi:hypothetical protein